MWLDGDGATSSVGVGLRACTWQVVDSVRQLVTSSELWVVTDVEVAVQGMGHHRLQQWLARYWTQVHWAHGARVLLDRADVGLLDRHDFNGQRWLGSGGRWRLFIGYSAL